ncbi:MAG: hypothetical protein ACOYNS_14070 [Bacteroidota bacterium]
MGNQQLLLILAGAIIVAIAISVGISMTREYYEDSSGDAVQQALVRVVNDAMVYYEKPKSLGGGGKSFKGYKLPKNNIDDDLARYTIGNLSNGIFVSAFAKGGGIGDQMTVAFKYDNGFQIDWDGYGLYSKWDTPDFVPYP